MCFHVKFLTSLRRLSSASPEPLAHNSDAWAKSTTFVWDLVIDADCAILPDDTEVTRPGPGVVCVSGPANGHPLLHVSSDTLETADIVQTGLYLRIRVPQVPQLDIRFFIVGACGSWIPVFYHHVFHLVGTWVCVGQNVFQCVISN